MERFKGVFQRTEQEPLTGQISYERTGNVSMTTRLNQDVADRFMRAADIRRDIVITDSNRLPRNEARVASSHTLSLLAAESLRRLRKISEQSFYNVRYDPDQARYELQIHDKMIDDKIRNRANSRHESYEERYLKELNKAVVSGLRSCVFQSALRLQIPGERLPLVMLQLKLHKKDFIIFKESTQ